MMLSHSATCQKIIPWGKHTQCDAHRALTSAFLFWEGKRVTPCFSASERLFLHWQERWEATQNLDPKHLSLKQVDEAQEPRYCSTPKRLLLMPQMLYINILLIWWDSCLRLLSLDTLVSPPCFTSLLPPAHQPSGSFFNHGLGVLLTNSFHLLRHDNPHSLFKFTAVMFQGFAQSLTGSTDRY